MTSDKTTLAWFALVFIAVCAAFFWCGLRIGSRDTFLEITREINQRPSEFEKN